MDDFDIWMNQIDKMIADKLLGLTTSDLPDMAYMDWFEDGYTPKEAVKEIFEELHDEIPF